MRLGRLLELVPPNAIALLMHHEPVSLGGTTTRT